MATTVAFFRPTMVRASAGSPSKPGPDSRKPVSSNWWVPLFGWPADADYMGSGPALKASEKSDPERPRSKFGAGCFTEEKAKALRKKTMETSTFHDIMYHSAIASRLASEGHEK
ncbi:hypothetical protein Fmac_012567 [Flemingia macrophylla]|uniref:Uncharacterized protein n=1 Tax=Flemingia macrophylla TaxID=520843 RepID=A0ABD1MQP4_9FABA